MTHQEDFNKIRVENEKLLLLQDSLGWDKARQLAVDYKVKAFGGLMSLIMKPKAEEIELIYEEKRYEAFWHIVGTAFFEYKRRQKYKVPVEKIVKDVEVLGKNFVVDQDAKTFTIESIEHCKEDYREEMMIEAKSDQAKDFKKYLQYPHDKIASTEELMKDGTQVVYMETRANTLVRKVLGNLVKPIKADEILREEITINNLNLFFYPVYTFEYFWKPKNKKVTVSFDGVTTEVNMHAAKITDTLKESFNTDDLFEFSKEIAANIIPGGGLAMMIGRKAFEIGGGKKK